MQSNHLDQTHDPQLRSWIESANADSSDFPIQNLPFGVFSRREFREVKHIGVAIGDYVVDLHSLMLAEFVPVSSADVSRACSESSLNRLMALEERELQYLRRLLSNLLSSSLPPAIQAKLQDFLFEASACEMQLPALIGGYTDFYASLDHAVNVGKLFRPDTPLLPNYKYMPIGYHGRTSSIVPSGAPIKRPSGQVKPLTNSSPNVGASSQLDYELELGLFVRGENSIGTPTPIDEAENRIFGFCLLNDWSARDIQTWEYQPLGPFLAKNFTTTISPWVVTLEALRPFQVPARQRSPEDPQLPSYLLDGQNQSRGGFAIRLEVFLQTETMKKAGRAPFLISSGNSADLYWTFSQMIAHHTSGGCNLRPGDLIGSGTISGSEHASRGCLLELTERGSLPIKLPNGELRMFLEDGDEVIFKGLCDHPNFRTIGFGECRGRIVGSHR